MNFVNLMGIRCPNSGCGHYFLSWRMEGAGRKMCPRILYSLPSLSYPMSSPYNTANTTVPVDEHWGVKLHKKCVVGCVSCEKTQCDGFAAQIYKSKTSFRLSFSRGGKQCYPAHVGPARATPETIAVAYSHLRPPQSRRRLRGLREAQ